jgi:hypothetical protein
MLVNEDRMNLRFTFWCLVVCAVVGLTASADAQTPSRRTRRAGQMTPAASTTQQLTSDVRARLAKVDTVGLPWIDNMESPGLWTADGFWHWQLLPEKIQVLNPEINPTLVTLPDDGHLPVAHSGNALWWFGEASTGTFIGSDFDRTQYPKSGGYSQQAQVGSMISPAINLKGTTRALLKFWSWWEIEAFESHSFDIMHVDVTTDTAGSWTPLGGGVLNPVDNSFGLEYVAYTSGGLGVPGRWIEQAFDLSEYANSVVYIRFQFNSGDADYNGFRGWLIDDVSVTGDTVGAPVLSSLSPRFAVANESIELTGTNLVNGASVYVDNTLIQPYATSVQDFGRLVFAAPALPGIHSVYVVNPDGKTSNLLARSLTISDSLAPKIDSIDPDSALAGTAPPILITGSNFSVGARVLIGGLPAPKPVVSSPATITSNVPLGLLPGTYNVEVINPDSLRSLLPLSFRVLPNGIVITPLGDQLVGHPQPIRINPPGGTANYPTASVYYRVGGLLTYDTLKVIPDSAGFRVDFPASAITPRGVEYWVMMQSLTGAVLTYPPVNPAYTPAVFPVSMPVLRSPVTLTPESYQMISAPLILDYPGPLVQLSDDFGPYSAGGWKLYRWHGDAYAEPPVLRDDFLPGNGFWLATANETAFNFRGATSVPSVAPFSVPVDTGWNQIGNPFAFPVSWSTVGQVNCSVWGGGPYAYDGVEYQISQVLAPFQAAFVYVKSGPGALSFYPIDVSVLGKGVERQSPAAGEFFVRVGAEVEGTPYGDRYNRIGFKSLASESVDAYDSPKPPAIGKGVELSIMENGVSYLEDFKPLNDRGQSWFVALRGRGVEGKAQISLEATGNLPPGFEIHVLDLIGENAVPVASGSFDASIPERGMAHYYKIIIGTADYADSQRDGIPLQPMEFALHQNYPNPFNPETRIAYSLGSRSDVTLEIYSSLGQMVRTLVRGEQTTGAYTVSWDGRSDAGRPVASGVYFSRLRAGEFTAVRKLMLIR